MSKIRTVQGNLLEATEQYIAHQCNCLTDHASGIAKAIFDRFPYADVYTPRRHLDYSPRNLIDGQKPGEIIICGNGEDQRYVINMFAQLYPGHPKYPDSAMDGFAARESYFRSCLKSIALIPGLESVAFPYKIGCNRGGGNWRDYENMLEGFANTVEASVVIYQLGDSITPPTRGGDCP